MTQRYISLAIDNLALTITKFDGSRFPRLLAEQPANARSTYGNFVGYGRIYEPPSIWGFTATLTRAEAEILEAIYSTYDYKRRTGSTASASDITLVDTASLQFSEVGTRTRATAPSPFNTVTTIATGKITYYAQFLVWFAQRPEFDWDHRVIKAKVALEECDRKVAP